jgi:hypothetical protein
MVKWSNQLQMKMQVFPGIKHHDKFPTFYIKNILSIVPIGKGKRRKSHFHFHYRTLFFRFILIKTFITFYGFCFNPRGARKKYTTENRSMLENIES